MKRLWLACLLLGGGLLLADIPAQAQSNFQTNRAFAPSVRVLGMGDAAAALPGKRTAFFYNPAHIGRTADLIPDITLAGVNASVSRTVFDQARFFNNRLQPALDTGIDNLSETELRRLYEDTFAQGQQRSSVNGQLLLPSLIIGAKGLGVGAGAFATTDVTYRISNAGLGLPQINLVGQTDVMGVVSAGIDVQRLLGFSGLAVGVTGKYTRRYLSIKNKPIDAFSSDEQVHILEASAIGFDVGALYEFRLLPMMGTLTFGAAIYDVTGSGFTYSYLGTPADLPYVGELVGSSLGSGTGPVDMTAINEQVAFANEEYALAPSYRVGVAYEPPSLGVLGNVGFAADYIGYRDPVVEQSFWTHLHMGMQVELLSIFKLRGGLSQGYPTLGAGLGLGFIHIDYAYHGVEEGRMPGQLYNPQHTAQVALAF